MKPVPTKQLSKIVVALGMTTVMAGCSTVTDYIHSIHGDQPHSGYKSTETAEYTFEEQRIGGKTICSATYKIGSDSIIDFENIIDTADAINNEHKVQERCTSFEMDLENYMYRTGSDNFYLFLDQRNLPSRCGLFYGDSATPDNVTEELEWELASTDLFDCRYFSVRDMAEEMRTVLK
ncbi:hypothetical protein B9Q17_07515 [Marinobacter vinifirmus]|uniref:Lipoprotein n=1 Tax=Marinobacter vinifirmus TaxID=355591 RepID=A0A7Z1DS85_9GAMM|nr:hypothetical protein [Marinobacter vinifirmus]OZC35055.1 hypothetical protein B9Q17_07515 [Marinobacter vinifirmus]